MDTAREIAEENYIMDHFETCGTCHYWQKDGSCMCFDSPFAAEYVDDSDGCNHYTAKRKIHYV